MKIKGFTLLATVFILVVLSLAGLYLMKIAALELQQVNYQLLCVRSAHALNSALNIAELQWKEQHKCPAQSFHFDQQHEALAGFDVVVTCSQMLSFPAERPTFYAIQLNAIATKGKFGGKDFVSQTVHRHLVISQ